MAISLLIYSPNSKEPADCELKGFKIMRPLPILMFYLDKRESGHFRPEIKNVWRQWGFHERWCKRITSYSALLPLCLEFIFLIVRLPNIYDLDVIHEEKELAWSSSLVILRKKFLEFQGQNVQFYFILLVLAAETGFRQSREALCKLSRPEFILKTTWVYACCLTIATSRFTLPNIAYMPTGTEQNLQGACLLVGGWEDKQETETVEAKGVPRGYTMTRGS